MLPIEQIDSFQGKLKSINEENFEKLKSSILKYGFSFPIFVWKNKILDGHQRFNAVKSLIESGEKLKGGKLPIVNINANSEKEAAEKLLLINSHYAKLDQDGFELFVKNFNIEIEDLSHLLEIDDVVIDYDDSDFDPENEWDGMPEFDQDDATPFRTLLVHFKNQNDLNLFLNLIDQQITENTKFIYYPKQERFDSKSKAFIDENES